MTETNPPTPGPTSTFAERLRWARKFRGYTSDRSAAAGNQWVVATYRKHESGERGEGGVKDHHIKRYARGFRISSVWLATGHGDPLRPEVGELTEEEARVIEALRASKRA